MTFHTDRDLKLKCQGEKSFKLAKDTNQKRKF